MNTVYIYTDGACSGNPGKGGYGAILVYGNHRKELSGSYRKTTNNRMELMAAIAALESLKDNGSRVVLTSDSKYLVDAFQKEWIRNWERTGFEKIQNKDLWTRLIALARRFDITFVWVKGHAGHPLNERCDALAVSAYTTDATQVDEGYEKPGRNTEPVLFADSESSSPEEILIQKFGTKMCGEILETLKRHKLVITSL